MASVPDSRPLDISHYLTVLKEQWRPIVVIGSLGLLAATGYLVVTGTSYTATTDLNINVISTDPFNAQRSASGLLDGVTEAQIAGSYAVALKAAESLNDQMSPAELRAGAHISTVADATIIRIGFTAESADDALAGADAMADAYLSYRATQAKQRLGGVIDRIEERLDGLRTQLTDANARAAESQAGTSEANQAASDRDLITIELDSLLGQKNSLDLIDTAGGSVLSAASENEVVSSPKQILVLLAGLLAGLVLGVIAAFVINGVTRRVSSIQDVERLTGSRVLARITSPEAAVPPIGSSLDEFRAARERIYAALGSDSRVIVLFDTSTATGLSDVPADLAVAFAQDGQPAHLLLPGLGNESRDWLVDRLALKKIDGRGAGSSYRSADGMLTLHASGRQDTSLEPDGLITEFVRETVDTADSESLVIIALPSAAPHSSNLAAGRLADAIAVIVTLGSTGQAELSALMEEPALTEIEMLGAIVVPASRRILENQLPAEETAS